MFLNAVFIGFPELPSFPFGKDVGPDPSVNLAAGNESIPIPSIPNFDPTDPFAGFDFGSIEIPLRPPNVPQRNESFTNINLPFVPGLGFNNGSVMSSATDSTP